MFDVLGRLGGRLQEDEAMLVGESLALLKRDGAPVLEVAFVANQHDCHV
jgi:hypothetical protein